jgi:hypothetical protein
MEVPIARPPASLLAMIACAFAVFAVLAAVAEAAPKRPVRIETEPPGATVYVGDKESGAAGVTPADLRLSPGEHTIILELIGHLPRFEVIQVTGGRRAKAQVVSFTLEPAVATIVVEGSDLPASARVFVDGEERGALPARIEVEPGAHQVEVIAEGRRPFEAWVEVAGGGEESVEVVLPRADVPVEAPSTVEESAAGPARPALVSAGAGFELGWRRFRYEEPITSNAQPFDADGVGLLTLWLELHPHRALRGARFLWPLSLVASYRHGLPLETDLQGDAVADAFWRAADIGLRYRIGLGPWVAVDLDAGWARTRFAFIADDGGEVDEVPDVDYQALRIGGRIVARPGSWGFWVGAENQIVLEGGLVEDRFRGADVDGYGLRAGLEATWWRGRIVTRAEATWTHYGWLFDTLADDEYQAAAGNDDLYGLSLAVGATY